MGQYLPLLPAATAGEAAEEHLEGSPEGVRLHGVDEEVDGAVGDEEHLRGGQDPPRGVTSGDQGPAAGVSQQGGLVDVQADPGQVGQQKDDHHGEEQQRLLPPGLARLGDGVGVPVHRQGVRNAVPAAAAAAVDRRHLQAVVPVDPHLPHQHHDDAQVEIGERGQRQQAGHQQLEGALVPDDVVVVQPELGGKGNSQLGVKGHLEVLGQVEEEGEGGHRGRVQAGDAAELVTLNEDEKWKNKFTCTKK